MKEKSTHSQIFKKKRRICYHQNKRNLYKYIYKYIYIFLYKYIYINLYRIKGISVNRKEMMKEIWNIRKEQSKQKMSKYRNFPSLSFLYLIAETKL